MIRFIGGPADKEYLALRRAPLFLRVVFNPKALSEKWDALDQVDDYPKPHELIYVYRRAPGPVGMSCLRGKGGGCYPIAEYRYVEPQPEEHEIRSNSRWREWCVAALEAEKK